MKQDNWYKTGFMGAAIAISAMAGAGFWFTATQWEPAITTAYITHRAPAVLGEETNMPSSAGQTGMTADEVDNLFQSYYQRPASQDEIAYWSGKTKELLTSSLEKNPTVKPQTTEIRYVPVYTPSQSEEQPTEVTRQPFHTPTTASQ
ncbi:MAG: hypothetical protein V1668_00830 [Patescibacteria group bacterium]